MSSSGAFVWHERKADSRANPRHKVTFPSPRSVPPDQGGEDAGRDGRPAAAAVSSAGRLPQAAGQRLGEGDQTEGTRGQSGESGERSASTPRLLCQR